jgi:hypothetical protein
MYQVIGTARDLGISKDPVAIITVTGLESRSDAVMVAAGMASRSDLEVIDIIDEDTMDEDD